MVYEYNCSLCDKVVEIERPMNEIGELSEENKAKLCCPGFGKCEFVTEEDKDIVDKITFIRAYTSVNFLNFDKLPSEEKTKILKKRASEDFKKNIEERKRVMQGTAISQLKSTFGK